MPEIQKIIVDSENAGQRVDKFLSAKMPMFSRSEIQKFVVKHANGSVAKMSEKTRVDDELTVEISPKKSDVAYDNISHDFDLDILYEDDDIIVINKPRGVVMYPSAGNKTGTLVQNLLAYTKLSTLGGTTRPGVVHRLDKNTSGVMVFAKSDAAYRGLVKIFSAHDLKGTSGNLGMTNLYRSSCKLTELLRNVQYPDMARIKSTFDELQNDFNKIIEILEKGITE